MIYLKKMHLSPLLVILIVSLSVGRRLAYDCYVEDCDWDKEFCNKRQQRCEHCTGHTHSCFTDKMERNCTKFCVENEHQKLKEQGCRYPPNVTSGHIVEPREFYEHGSELIYTCMPGYRMLGNPKSICGDYGQWTPLPLCEVVTCAALPKVEHGQIEYSEESDSDTLPVKTTARLTCDDGYVRHGTLVIQCSETGQWTHTMPFCVEEKVVTCPALPKVEHGQIVYSEESASEILSVKTKAQLTCDDGYERHGTLDIQCSETGQWTHTMPFCVKEKDSCLNPWMCFSLCIGCSILSPFIVYFVRLAGRSISKYLNKPNTKGTNKKEEEKIGLMHEHSDTHTVNMEPREHISNDIGVSKQRDKLGAEPLPLSQTAQPETAETQEKSVRDVAGPLQRQLSSSESDIHRSDPPLSVSTSGPSRSEDPLGCSTSNNGELSRQEPNLSQSSESSSKSKDSGFDSSNTIHNNGPNNGNFVQMPIRADKVVVNNTYHLRESQVDSKDVDPKPANKVSTFAVEETGETKIPEQPSTEAVAETTECKV